MPRLIKNIFGKSTKFIVAKIISVGKNAISSKAIKAIRSFPVNSFAILYVRARFAIEMKKGKIIVAVSFMPNILNDIAVIKMCTTRNKKIG